MSSSITVEHIHEMLDKILADEQCRSEIIAAKEHFEGMTGSINQSQNDYTEYVNSFHNWYILDRKLVSYNETPLRRYSVSHYSRFSPHDQQALGALEDGLHSLFECVKTQSNGIVVKSLLNKKRYTIADPALTTTIERGEMFNTRIFPVGKDWKMSNYIIIHPQSAKKIIKAQAAKMVKQPIEEQRNFLFKLLKYQNNWKQFTQMEVVNVYRF